MFTKNSFRNELKSPFLPSFDTQHSICEIFTFLLFGCKGVPGVSEKCCIGCKQKFSKIKFNRATKSWEKSRNFRYELLEDFWRKGQKTVGGGVDSTGHPPPLPVLIGLMNYSLVSLGNVSVLTKCNDSDCYALYSLNMGGRLFDLYENNAV